VFRFYYELRTAKFVKHSEKICSVCGGHLICINFPPRNWEEYYANFSRMGGKLCLLVRGKNPPTIAIMGGRDGGGAGISYRANIYSLPYYEAKNG
jgi:hypothetical protein